VLGGKTQEGLVHCSSRQEYDLLLAKLSVKWDEDEAEEQERKGDKQEPMASKYFMKNKVEIVYCYDSHCYSDYVIVHIAL